MRREKSERIEDRRDKDRRDKNRSCWDKKRINQIENGEMWITNSINCKIWMMSVSFSNIHQTILCIYQTK